MLTANLDPHGDPPTCTTCTVGAPYGEFCFAGVETFSDAACSEDPTVILFGSDYCNSLGNSMDVSYMGISAPEATYSCEVPDQTPTIPPLTWSTAAVGCAPPTPSIYGCGASRLCLPNPTSPFESRLCISKSGDKACPTQTYTQKTLFYTSVSDTRTCTPCGYTTTPISCDATVVMYSDIACGTSLVSVTDFSGQCGSLPGTVGSTKLVGSTFTGTPSCSPVGGAPAGMVAPTNPITVCCTP